MLLGALERVQRLNLLKKTNHSSADFCDMNIFQSPFRVAMLAINASIVLSCSALGSDQLREIVCSGDIALLTSLLRTNPALGNHVLDNGDGVPFLVYAAGSGRNDIVELLVRGKRCSPEVLYEALFAAVRDQYKSVVKNLLKNGARPNLPTKEVDFTPLHMAVMGRDPTITWMLLRYGASARAVDSKNRTPLHWCKNPLSAELLIRAGADVNAVDSSGYNALHVFGTERQIVDSDTVRVLIEQGINVNAVDKAGLTPLALATKNEQKELVDAIDMALKLDGGNPGIHIQGDKPMIVPSITPRPSPPNHPAATPLPRTTPPSTPSPSRPAPVSPAAPE